MSGKGLLRQKITKKSSKLKQAWASKAAIFLYWVRQRKEINNHHYPVIDRAVHHSDYTIRRLFAQQALAYYQIVRPQWVLAMVKIASHCIGLSQLVNLNSYSFTESSY